MTRGDRILIAALVCVTLLSWPLTTARAGGQEGRAVISGPRGESVVPLEQDAEYRVDGSIGEVVLRVADGSIRVVRSGCPDQTCVRTRPAGTAGSVIACVPNGVVVRVGGPSDAGLDARIR